MAPKFKKPTKDEEPKKSIVNPDKGSDELPLPGEDGDDNGGGELPMPGEGGDDKGSDDKGSDDKGSDDKGSDELPMPGEGAGGAMPPGDAGMGGGAGAPPAEGGQNIVNQQPEEKEPAISAEAKKGGMVLRSVFLKDVGVQTGHLGMDNVMRYLSQSPDFNIENTDDNRHKVFGELAFIEDDKTLAELENSVGQDEFWGAIFRNASAITTSSSDKDVVKVAESIADSILAMILERLQ